MISLESQVLERHLSFFDGKSVLFAGGIFDNFPQTLPKTNDYYCILKANVFKNQQCPIMLFDDILNISLVELFDEDLNKPNWYFVARAISNPNCPENVLRFIFNNDIFKIYSKAFLLNEKCPQDIISDIKKIN